MCVERNTAILPLPQETVYATGGRGNPRLVTFGQLFKEVENRVPFPADSINRYLIPVTSFHNTTTSTVNLMPRTVRRKGRIVRFI